MIRVISDISVLVENIYQRFCIRAISEISVLVEYQLFIIPH